MSRRVLSNCRNAEEAEAQACLDGLRDAARWPEAGVWLESDCATVMEKAKSSSTDRSLSSGLIQDIKSEGRLKHSCERAKARW